MPRFKPGTHCPKRIAVTTPLFYCSILFTNIPFEKHKLIKCDFNKTCITSTRSRFMLMGYFDNNFGISVYLVHIIITVLQ